MNLATLRADVLDYMDATGNARWSTDIVDRRISSVFDQIYRRLLNANPYYLVGQRTPTSDSTGFYSLDSLNIGVGDTLQRTYKVIAVVIDGFTYDGPLSLAEWAPRQLTNSTTQDRIWYQNGQGLSTLPSQAAKAADAIWVNYIPQRPAEYDSDDSEVVFPDGHEEVLVAMSAARLLMKGGAETQASAEITASIKPHYDELIADVTRFSTRPLALTYNDAALEWGQ